MHLAQQLRLQLETSVQLAIIVRLALFFPFRVRLALLEILEVLDLEMKDAIFVLRDAFAL